VAGDEYTAAIKNVLKYSFTHAHRVYRLGGGKLRRGVEWKAQAEREHRNSPSLSLVLSLSNWKAGKPRFEFEKQFETKCYFGMKGPHFCCERNSKLGYFIITL